MRKYENAGYCSLCGKWWDLKDLKKLYIKGVKAYVYYCPIHKKQVRLKARGKPMGQVKLKEER